MLGSGSAWALEDQINFLVDSNFLIYDHAGWAYAVKLTPKTPIARHILYRIYNYSGIFLWGANFRSWFLWLNKKKNSLLLSRVWNEWSTFQIRSHCTCDEHIPVFMLLDSYSAVSLCVWPTCSLVVQHIPAYYIIRWSTLKPQYDKWLTCMSVGEQVWQVTVMYM